MTQWGPQQWYGALVALLSTVVKCDLHDVREALADLNYTGNV